MNRRIIAGYHKMLDKSSGNLWGMSSLFIGISTDSDIFYLSVYSIHTHTHIYIFYLLFDIYYTIHYAAFVHKRRIKKEK